MKCERCGKNEATVYVSSNINDHVSEQHLCAECARELGLAKRLQPLFAEEMLHPFGMMESLLRPFGAMEPMLRSFGSRLLSEFPAPAEEEAVGGEEPLVSAQEQEKLQKDCRRNALRSQLTAAVEREDYEEAARLRDQLRELDK